MTEPERCRMDAYCVLPDGHEGQHAMGWRDCTCRAFSGARDCPQHGFAAGGQSSPAISDDMSDAELDRLLDRPFTFDMLRDPDWQPSREDYRSMRDGLRAEAERLREHLKHWESGVHAHTGACEAAEDEITKLRAEAERLREALRVFGSHSSRCHLVIAGQYQDPPDNTCTCGLSDITALPSHPDP